MLSKHYYGKNIKKRNQGQFSSISKIFQNQKMKPVQYLVKFCKHKKYDGNLVRNRTRNRKMEDIDTNISSGDP